jgi:hypothetical protein
MSSTYSFQSPAVGLWFQLEADLRPLRSEEFPGFAPVDDDRMVVWAETAPHGILRMRDRGWYAPLRASDLSAHFMRLFAGAGRPRAARVREFYARYGALKETSPADHGEIPAWAAHLPPESRASLADEARLLLCEPLWWVRRRAREVRRTYDLYLALRADDPQSLRALLPRVPEGMHLDRLKIEDGHIIPYVAEEEPKRSGRRRVGSAAVEQREESISPERPRRPLTDEECRGWGRWLLAEQLSRGEQGSDMKWYLENPQAKSLWHPQVASGVPGLVRARRFRSLLAAIYVQLADMVSDSKVYQICLGCGGPFHPSDGRQRYCDPRCGDAARQRLFYRQPGKARARKPRGKATRSD